MESIRYFIEVAYNGSDYHGWQIQKNAHSVQAELEDALSVLLRKETSVMGSGRTDTGVHALQQFVHFDTDSPLDPELFIRKINGILPPDIAIYDVKQVRADAHARFHALWRSYVYRICLRKNPFELESAWLTYKNPDFEKLNQAAALLLEYTDFECFSKIKTNVHTFNCKIKEAYWEQNGSDLRFHITANRFLRGMVRAIVGTLMEVGTGKIDIIDFRKILESKKRTEAKSSAPAQGLYLCKITYPEQLFL